MPTPGKAEFEQVVRAYATDLFRYLYWLCRDRGPGRRPGPGDVRRAWAAWQDPRDEKAVKAWLYTIARNEHARLYEKKRPDVDPEAELDTLVAAPARPRGSRSTCARSFGLLPEAFRDCLLMQVLGRPLLGRNRRGRGRHRRRP
jgi:RNA polymerase sigma-70 factor (ECF subfamily)